MAPAAKRPLRDAKQISRIGLGEFARFIPIQYAPELDHSHTLKGFRTAHPRPSKGPSITGQIVRYLNRTYHVLSTVTPGGGRTEDRHCAEIFAFYTLPIYLPQEDWLLSLDPASRHHASET